MTVQELTKELEIEFKQKKIKIPQEYIPHVATLTFASNYIQILYDYGIEVLLGVLEVIEEHGFYEQCLVLIKVIENTNKLEGTDFPTRYSKL